VAEPNRLRYPSALDMVCPTCNGANQSEIEFTASNCIKVLLSARLWTVLGTDLYLIRLQRKCRVCGARLTPPRIARESERKCWRCGYRIRGLARTQCPECGTEFPPCVPYCNEQSR